MARFALRSAVHLFFVRAGQILLLRRANTGYEDGNYSVPAGHLEGGEPVLAAAAREAREEVGLALDPAALQVVGVMHRRSDDERVDFFALADAWQGEPHNAEPDKCDDLRWFRLDALPDNVVPYVRRAISNYLNHIPFDSYGWDAGEKE
jgi:ADP-ribose pyrophosphatase YjhB (NUDIX family)